MDTGRNIPALVIREDGSRIKGWVSNWGDGWAVVNGQRQPMKAMVVVSHA